MINFLTSCIVLYSFISSTNMFTMDLPLTVRKVTAVEEPILTGLLHNKNAVIANSSGYHIVDTNDNAIIHSILCHPFRFALNKKKSLIGIQTFEKFLVYDTITNSITWKLDYDPSFDSSVFTANNIFWVLKENGTMINNLGKEYLIPSSNTGNTCCCSHPTKEKIFYTTSIALQKNLLCRINLKEGNPTITQSILPDRLPCNLIDNEPITKIHSYQGNILAFYWPIDRNWSLYDHEKQEEICKLPQCNNLALHPNKHILAMITADGLLQIYNFKEDKILDQLNMENTPYPSTTPLNEITMDFSLDGKQLIFMFRGNCYLANIAPILFE